MLNSPKLTHFGVFIIDFAWIFYLDAVDFLPKSVLYGKA